MRTVLRLEWQTVVVNSFGYQGVLSTVVLTIVIIICWRWHNGIAGASLNPRLTPTFETITHPRFPQEKWSLTATP